MIGTPGRIKDLSERGVLALEHVAFAALDEADQMLDMVSPHLDRTPPGLCPARRSPVGLPLSP